MFRNVACCKKPNRSPGRAHPRAEAPRRAFRQPPPQASPGDLVPQGPACRLLGAERGAQGGGAGRWCCRRTLSCKPEAGGGGGGAPLANPQPAQEQPAADSLAATHRCKIEAHLYTSKRGTALCPLFALPGARSIQHNTHSQGRRAAEGWGFGWGLGGWGEEGERGARPRSCGGHAGPGVHWHRRLQQRLPALSSFSQSRHHNHTASPYCDGTAPALRRHCGGAA
jgi:hypothetical protein